LTPSKKYALNTNYNGEERAFVMTGQYEQVFPFDIYPVQLVKAVITNDFEGMENLGIYEVAPEDFALCEFVCTSKIESQKIIREGLDYVRSES
jgi:Na+-transporting NADH:ubiquinone oxidoreductase subunit A